MTSISPALEFFVQLAKAKAVLTRRFDQRLSLHGLGFTDFVILFQLSLATDGRMRRIDLAERVGVTASGITRLLLPMEKIGLVQRQSSDRDARVAYVLLAPAGRQILTDAVSSAENLSQDLLPLFQVKKMKEFIEILTQLGSIAVF